MAHSLYIYAIVFLTHAIGGRFLGALFFWPIGLHKGKRMFCLSFLDGNGGRRILALDE